MNRARLSRAKLNKVASDCRIAAWEEVLGYDEHEVKRYSKGREHFVKPYELINKWRPEGKRVSQEDVRRAAHEKMALLQAYDSIVDQRNLSLEDKMHDPRIRNEMLLHALGECDAFGIDRKYAEMRVDWYMSHHAWIVKQTKNLGTSVKYLPIDGDSENWLASLKESETSLAISLTGKAEIGELLWNAYRNCVHLHDAHRLKEMERHDDAHKLLMRDAYASYLEILIVNMQDSGHWRDFAFTPIG